MKRKRSDVWLGAAVLAAIVALAAWSFTLDGPIRAPIPIATQVEELVGEGDKEPFPLGDVPCQGTVEDEVLICTEVIRLRTDLETTYSTRPLLGADGPVFAGGPTSPELGFLVYRVGEELRVTTSRKHARRVAPESPEIRLFFGYLPSE